MDLGEYYKKKKNNEINLGQLYIETLEYGKARLSNSREDLTKLRTELNDLFYGQKQKDISKRQQIEKYVVQAFEKVFKRKLDGFNMMTFSTKTGTENIDGLDTIPALIQQIGQTTESSKIQVRTLKNRQSQIENYAQQLESFLQSSNVIDNQKLQGLVEELRNTCRDLLTKIQTALDATGSSEADENKFYQANKKDINIQNTINEINNSYAKLFQLTQGGFTPVEIGWILEFIVAATSKEGEQIIKKLVEDGVDDFAKALEEANIMTGKIRTGTNASSSFLNFSTEITNKTQKTMEKFLSSEKVSAEYKQLKFKFQKDINWNANRQAKMDISYTLPADTDQEPFRISLKNWNSLSGQDFGETSLLYALLRSLDIDNTDMVIFNASDKKNVDQNNISRIMKLSAILDILMGFSQKEGYIDTIVINDRTKSCIIVESMSSILDKVEKNIDQLNIRGFGKFIFNDLQNLRNRFVRSKNGGNSERTRRALYSYLQAIKVAVTSSILNLK